MNKDVVLVVGGVGGIVEWERGTVVQVIVNEKYLGKGKIGNG